MISLHIRATIDPTQISEARHAYTKGKSTESALHLVVSSIEKSLSIKEYTPDVTVVEVEAVDVTKTSTNKP